MTTATTDPEARLYPEDAAVLNAMVTYAMENVPGLANGPAERRVAKVVGRWALGVSEGGVTEHVPVMNAEDAARVRDNAITTLCLRLTSLVDRELMQEDNSFLVREDVREALDDYITDAERTKVGIMRGQVNAPEPTTRLVHMDGGIDALQEIRERLLGERLALRKPI